MNRHFHLIARTSPAKAAVRDLQNQAESLRITRTSGMRIRRTAKATHTLSLADEVTASTGGTSEARWA